MGKRYINKVKIDIIMAYIIVFTPVVSGIIKVSQLSQIDDFIVVYMIIIAIRQIFSKRKHFIRNYKLIIIMSLFISISIFQNVPIKNLLLGSLFLYKPIIIFIYFRSREYTVEESEMFINSLKKIAFIVLFFAVIDVIFYPNFRILVGLGIKNDKTLLGIAPITSIFTTPNLYSYFMGYWCIYYYTQYYTDTNNKTKNGITAIIFFIATIFSLRRKSLLGIIMIVGYSFFILNKNINKLKIRSKIMVSSIMVVFCVLNIGNLKLFANEYFNENAYANGGYNTRYLLMDVGKDIADDNFPIGEGVGMFGGYASSIYYSDIYNERWISNLYGFSEGGSFYTGDNYFGHIMGEVGYLGFLIMIILFIKGVYTLRKNLDKNRICIFALMIIIASISENFGLCIYEITMPSYLIFSIVGISYSIIDDIKG